MAYLTVILDCCVYFLVLDMAMQVIGFYDWAAPDHAFSCFP